MFIPNDSYQTMTPPDYWEDSTEEKVGNALDIGQFLPQVSFLIQNLSDEAYPDLDILVAELIKERCLNGKDLGDKLNKDVDKFIQQIGANS